jgi:ketopantoate reductase
VAGVPVAWYLMAPRRQLPFTETGVADKGVIPRRPEPSRQVRNRIAGVEVVLLGVKAWQVREAARMMRPAIGPATFVVPLQNGVDAASELATVLGSGHVLAGLCGTF